MREQAIQHKLNDWWRRALVSLMVAAALLLTLADAGEAAGTHTLVNGSFEHGFTVQAGCGSGSQDFESSVGTGWRCFTNRGAARYGFYADAWVPVVANGQFSQLIEINTWGVEHGDNDRYAGIYQTMPVTAGADYRLSLRGMIRTTNLEGDPWRYRVQVGFLQGTGTDWRKVRNWTDAGWDKYYPSVPGALATINGYQRAKRADHPLYPAYGRSGVWLTKSWM